MSENKENIIPLDVRTETVADVIKNNLPDDIKQVVEAAEQAASDNEDIMSVREVSERAENYVPEEPLRSEVASFPVDNMGNPNYTITADSGDESDIDLLQAIDESFEGKTEEEISDKVMQQAKDKMNLSDEDAAMILDCILAYRRDPKTNIYSHLPKPIKSLVSEIMMKNDIPYTERNNVAKMIIQEFISEAEVDETFIDFEGALNRAMQIPSLTDLYSEHLAETVDKKLPAMADAIEAEDPEKAKTLRTIAERFEWSISYDNVKSLYDGSAAIRKAVRRDYDKWHKMALQVNFIVKDTKFRMPDATVVGTVLHKVLLEENDSDITEVDVSKFLVALYKGIDPYRENTVENMAYIYYLLKNIIMLSYTNEQAKGSFSAELISNIKTMIYYIRVRESEFNAINANMQPNKRDKRSKRNKHRK